MGNRMEALCAELCAIDYWEWLYRESSSRTESDGLSHALRQARRAAIMSEIQVLHFRSALQERSAVRSSV